MKISVFLFITTLFTFTAGAQYKKATFFTKKGRIYDVGLTTRIQGDGRSTMMGAFVSFGKQSSVKRIHHWYDLELTMGSKYTYASTEISTPNKVQVSGKSNIGFTFRYNLAYFLKDNSNEDEKWLPFVNAGLAYVMSPVVDLDYTIVPANTYPVKYPMTSDGTLLYGAGGGMLYKLNNKTSLRIAAMYNGAYQSLVNNKNTSYLTLGNHLAVNLALRFMMQREKN